MRLILGIAVIAVMGLSACENGAVTERSFTSEVLEGLSGNGMAYIRKVRKTDDFQRILDEIAGGNGLIIDNIYLMRPELNDAEENAVRHALSHALKVKPQKVLALLPAHYGFDEVCGIPGTVEQGNREAFAQEAISALTSMEVRFNARQKNRCINGLEKMQTTLSS